MKNYSAEVDIWMDCGKHGKIPLSQASSTFVISAVPADIPACIARIVLVVDGREIVRDVKLVAGMSTKNREAMISSYDSISPF